MFGNKKLTQQLEALTKRVKALEGQSTDKYIVVQRTLPPLLRFPAIPGSYIPNVNKLHGLGRDDTMKRIATDIGEIYGLMYPDVRRTTTGQLLLSFEDIQGNPGIHRPRVGYVMEPEQLSQLMQTISDMLSRCEVKDQPHE